MQKGEREHVLELNNQGIRRSCTLERSIARGYCKGAQYNQQSQDTTRNWYVVLHIRTVQYIQTYCSILDIQQMYHNRAVALTSQHSDTVLASILAGCIFCGYILLAIFAFFVFEDSHVFPLHKSP